MKYLEGRGLLASAPIRLMTTRLALVTPRGRRFELAPDSGRLAEAFVGPVVLGVELEDVLEEIEGEARLTGRDRALDGLEGAVDRQLNHVLELLLVGLGQSAELLLLDLVIKPLEAVTEASACDRVAGSLDSSHEDRV